MQLNPVHVTLSEEPVVIMMPLALKMFPFPTVQEHGMKVKLVVQHTVEHVVLPVMQVVPKLPPKTSVKLVLVESTDTERRVQTIAGLVASNQIAVKTE
jgi:hypothetical protein